MELQSTPAAVTKDEPLIDGKYIDSDLGIVPRTRRNYLSKQILPAPDANLRGRDVWRLSTYLKFKDELLAGKFALERRPPHLRAAKPAA